MTEAKTTRKRAPKETPVQTTEAVETTTDISSTVEVNVATDSNNSVSLKESYDLLTNNIGNNAIKDFRYSINIENGNYLVDIEMKVCEIRHLLNVVVPTQNEDGSPSLLTQLLQAEMNDDRRSGLDRVIKNFIDATLGAGSITKIELKGICIKHR